MAVARISLILIIACCLGYSWSSATRSVRIEPSLVGVPNYIAEDSFAQLIEFYVESLGFDGTTVTPVPSGDLEIKIVVSTGTGGVGDPDVEPGFDFTPDTGPLPATFTLTIEEGESESNRFQLQILDDCHEEMAHEVLEISLANVISTTSTGVSYGIIDETAFFTIVEATADTGVIEIQMAPEYPEVGFIFYEDDVTRTYNFPVRGVECSNPSRQVPIDDTCEAVLTATGGVYDDPLVEDGQYTINAAVTINHGATDFADIEIVGDTIPEPLDLVRELHFGSAACSNAPLSNTAHQLDATTLVEVAIIDDDSPNAYGIVYPASIDRRSKQDVNVYTITAQLDVPTEICRNDKVCPYTSELPLCKSTDLECGSDGTYGKRTTFPKPKQDSRDRFGSYILTAGYDPIITIPVFVSPLSDALEPREGPTVTINNGEDVCIGVQHSKWVSELRWTFNGKDLPEYRGKCNIRIKEAKYGENDGFYEVYRVQRGKRGYKTIIRLIIRKCERNKVKVAASPCGFGPSCINGGILENEEFKCVCPEGLYGDQCKIVEPSNFRIGPLGKGLDCSDLDEDIPKDCKGALFCFRDPLGCLCARGYWGSKCDRICPRGRFGWGCRLECHCPDWDSCDPKTGLCKSGSCGSGYRGPNCQFPAGPAPT